MNHAQFRELLKEHLELRYQDSVYGGRAAENLLNEFDKLPDVDATIYELKQEIEAKKLMIECLTKTNHEIGEKLFNLPDVAAELLAWIDSQNKFDNEMTTHISIFQLKNKLKELSK